MAHTHAHLLTYTHTHTLTQRKRGKGRLDGVCVCLCERERADNATLRTWRADFFGLVWSRASRSGPAAGRAEGFEHCIRQTGRSCQSIHHLIAITYETFNCSQEAGGPKCKCYQKCKRVTDTALSLSLSLSHTHSLSLSLPPPPSKVVPRGSADRTGRIRVGDQILRVNNTDAVGLNVTDLRNIIIGEQVCIRQHSSAYLHVSIRIAYVQLTSAYV